jgi:cellulose synthase (UDP-forming)
LRPVAMGGAVAVLLVSATLRLPAGVEGMLWGSGLTLGSDRSISEMVRGPDTVQLGVYDWNDTFGDEDYVAIEHEFVSWLDDLSGPLADFARYARQRNRWPMVTVEPWSDGREGSSTLLGAVNGGLYDQEIARSCKALAAIRVPIFVRWGHEMETPTGRYPWADFDSGAYVKAYQRFVEICRRHGKEFYYVWSPRGDDGLHRYYPGLEYVDIIGLSLYSYAAYELDYFGRIRSFAENLSERYDRVRDYKKTVMIAELGVDGTMEYRRQWLADGLAQLHGFPLVHSIVYFNAPDSPEAWGEDWPKPDWSIDPRVFTAGPNQLRIESARGD